MAHVYVKSGAAGAADGSTWADAYTTLAAALAAKAAGDQFWVSEDHSETTAGSISLTSPGTAAAPCTIRCVDHAGTVPPVSADLRATAILACTGGNSINFTGYADCDGIEFRASNSTSSGNFNICTGASGGGWRFGPGSKLTLVGTGTTSLIVLGSTTASVASRVELVGVIIKFANVLQGIRLQGARSLWRGGSIDAAGSIPTTLINSATGCHIAVFEGFDFSAMGSGKTIVGALASPADVHLKDCKRDAAVTIAATPAAPGGGRVFTSRVSSTGVVHVERQYLYTGSEVAVSGVVRTGGAAASHQIDSTANAKFILPYLGLPLAIWNPTTAADVIVTVEGIANMAAIPKNDECWFEVEYLGTSGNPMGVFKSGAKADILASGASLTASTQAWDTGATARADSTAYALGDVVKLASNPGRLFFCTTAGTTAASEPGGYAGAVDGGSVNDGTAVFRAGFRFKQAVTLTSPQPQLAGLLYVYPKIGVASATIYLDRKIALS